MTAMSTDAHIRLDKGCLLKIAREIRVITQ